MVFLASAARDRFDAVEKTDAPDAPHRAPDTAEVSPVWLVACFLRLPDLTAAANQLRAAGFGYERQRQIARAEVERQGDRGSLPRSASGIGNRGPRRAPRERTLEAQFFLAVRVSCHADTECAAVIMATCLAIWARKYPSLHQAEAVGFGLPSRP